MIFLTRLLMGTKTQTTERAVPSRETAHDAEAKRLVAEILATRAGAGRERARSAARAALARLRVPA